MRHLIRHLLADSTTTTATASVIATVVPMTDSEQQQHYKRLALVDPETLYKSSRAGLLHHVPAAAATTSAATTAVAAASTSTAPNLPPLPDERTEKNESSAPATAARLPADMAYYHKQAEQSLHPDAALHQVLQFIYRDLDLVLNDPTLESREKMLKYRRLLNRLQFFLANPHNSNISSSYSSSPPAHLRQSAEEASASLLERLVNQVPKRNRTRTVALYKQLEKSGVIKWNEDGAVREMSGRRIPPEHRINIVDLLNDAARFRKTAPRPAGYSLFTKALREAVPTDSLIGNHLYKASGPGQSLDTRLADRGRKRPSFESEEGEAAAAVAAADSSLQVVDDQSSDDEEDDRELFQTPTSYRSAPRSKKRKARNRLAASSSFTPSRDPRWANQ